MIGRLGGQYRYSLRIGKRRPAGARCTAVLIASLVENGNLVRDQNVVFVILYSRCARTGRARIICSDRFMSCGGGNLVCDVDVSKAVIRYSLFAMRPYRAPQQVV